VAVSRACQLVSSVVIAALPVVATGQVPVGGEFQVNTHTRGYQIRPSVAAHADGGFVVVWMAERARIGGASASAWDLLGRRYDASGNALDVLEFPVSSSKAISHQNPEVAPGPAGGFVATWLQLGAVLRRFDAGGAPLAAESPVAASGVAPSVASDVARDFVVAWHEPNYFPATRSVHARRYDAAGAPQGEALRVDSGAGYPGFPQVARDSAGNFVVAWTSFGQDGSGSGIFARRYDALGNAFGPEFQVNTRAASDQHDASVAMGPDGRFVIVWTGAVEQELRRGVFGQRFDPSGAPDGVEFAVSTQTTLSVAEPRVAFGADGTFVVAWTGSVFGTFPLVPPDVFARRFDASGVPVGAEFRVNSHTTGGQSGPVIAGDGSGGYVVAWTSGGQDGDAAGVFAQRFGPDQIFADGFESGGLAAWSASSGGADLPVAPEAAMRSSTAGLQGNVNDTQGLWVQDDSPRGEHRYYARFYFDPGDFDPGEAEQHFRTRLFVGFDESPTRRLFAVVLRRVGGQYALMGRARHDDGTRADTGFVPISADPQAIEVAWHRASAPTASDGSFEMWIDGQPAGEAPALDNDGATLDFVRLGALSVKSGASGTLYWDEFASKRASAIGP
jgi:hypothetical protein